MEPLLWVGFAACLLAFAIAVSASLCLLAALVGFLRRRRFRDAARFTSYLIVAGLLAVAAVYGARATAWQHQHVRTVPERTTDEQ